jgi:hypothetical protein
MTTTGSNVLTLADWAKRLDPNGRVDRIVEILNATNEVLDDMQWVQANDGTSHRTTIRTGIPEAAWRMLNYGVPSVKSSTAQVRDTTGMLEVYSECDKALADMSDDLKNFRLSEAKPIMEGMSQQMASTIFYGNVMVNPERFLGLAPRYNSLSAGNKDNIIDAGGTGVDNTSVWLVGWGENTCHGLFPKGSKAGLQHTDKGQVTLEDAEKGKYEGFRDHFKWDAGLTLRDWRYVVRVANIDVSLLSSDTAYLKAIIGKLIEAEERIPTMNGGRFAWYGNGTIRAALRNAILEKVASNLTEETVAGKRVTMFDGIPFRKVDALINAEARVV